MALKLDTSILGQIEKIQASVDSFQNGAYNHLDINLTSLIEHSNYLDKNSSLADSLLALKKVNTDYIAVLSNNKFLGITSKNFIEKRIAEKPLEKEKCKVEVCLVENTLSFSKDKPVVEVLVKAFNRAKSGFYDDIAILDNDGKYLGLISMRSLLILQNWIFMENIQQLQNQRQKMRQNLRLAHQLQLAMFPQKYPSFPSHVPPEESKLKFHHTYFYPDLLGGDFFHIVYLSNYRAGLFMSDVLGHDVSSALVTSMLRALVASYRSIADNPGMLLSKLNNKFIELLAEYPETMYATANYLIVDVEKKIFEYASAGHPIPIRLNSRTQTCELMEVSCQNSGPPLGILKDTNFETSRGTIELGDLFLTFTDGIYEVFDENNRQFGINRLIASFAKHLQKPPLQIFQDVLKDVEQFAENQQFTDDISLVGVEVADLEGPNSEPLKTIQRST